MAPAFFECLILVGIHSYLGLHVIRRKVIFVDLALAQIAALGTTVGFLFGIMPGTTGAYWFSLLFTFVGAAVFSIARFRNNKIPQEAIIGLTYAIAAALAILVIDKAPHGAEHIKELLTGSILWVKLKTIETAAIVYAGVGIFHFIFRKKFFLISENPELAEKQGISVRFWDFLFYVSFGIVITHSVGTAGVLLVFVFLVVPAIASMMITDVLWKQLAIGWSLGLVVSVSGLYVSYVADLPSGPTVVVFYGALLVIFALFLYVKRTDNKIRALRNILIGLLATVLIFYGFSALGKYFNSEDKHEIHNRIENSSHQTNIEKLSDDELVKFLSNETSVKKLTDIFTKTDDDLTKIKIAKRIADLDKKKGLTLLSQIVEQTNLPFIEFQAFDAIKSIAGNDFGYSEKGKKYALKKLNEKLR